MCPGEEGKPDGNKKGDFADGTAKFSVRAAEKKKKKDFFEFGTKFCLDVVEQENPGGNSFSLAHRDTFIRPG